MPSLYPSFHHEVSASGFRKELLGTSWQFSAAEGAHLGNLSCPKALDARPMECMAARKSEGWPILCQRVQTNGALPFILVG